MLLRKNTEKPRLLLFSGLALLILASCERFFLPRLITLPENIADGLLGLSYGLAIGLLLLSLVARRRGAAPG